MNFSSIRWVHLLAVLGIIIGVILMVNFVLFGVMVTAMGVASLLLGGPEALPLILCAAAGFGAAYVAWRGIRYSLHALVSGRNKS